nr:STAS domain-containing protein [uncultured Allomuricauda sp.]
MALQITECKRVFSINGNLDSTNIKIFERHMERFVQRGATVVLDLKRVPKIDDIATRVLIQMFANALLLDCDFAINGWLPRRVLNKMCLEANL